MRSRVQIPPGLPPVVTLPVICSKASKLPLTSSFAPGRFRPGLGYSCTSMLVTRRDRTRFRSRAVQKLIRALKCPRSGLTGGRRTQSVSRGLDGHTQYHFRLEHPEDPSLSKGDWTLTLRGPSP